jgi:DNA-binding PadR family transcriptional regulator
MLSPVERLRFRPEALDDLEWDGLIVAHSAGDERMVSITEAGDAWLRRVHAAERDGGGV